MTIYLDDNQVSMLKTALEVACAQFQEDAKNAETERLEQQFNRQAEFCKEMIENNNLDE